MADVATRHLHGVGGNPPGGGGGSFTLDDGGQDRSPSRDSRIQGRGEVWKCAVDLSSARLYEEAHVAVADSFEVTRWTFTMFFL